jgi:hypothetical protein
MDVPCAARQTGGDGISEPFAWRRLDGQRRLARSGGGRRIRHLPGQRGTIDRVRASRSSTTTGTVIHSLIPQAAGLSRCPFNNGFDQRFGSGI